MAVPLLELQDLTVLLDTKAGALRAVDRVSLVLHRRQALGLVGESGSGKTLLALSLARLGPPGARVSGRALWNGADLLALDGRRLRAVRGRGIGYVFQEPATALNPVSTVGEQIAEAIRVHQGARGRRARELAVEALREVQISGAERCARQYPHQLSGGMRQRVLLAMALACRPELLVADEPTTALDASLQVQILALLAAMQRQRGLALLLISHDLSAVARACDQVAVLYAGRVVETGPARALLEAPLHPYTRGLLTACRPAASTGGRRPRLLTLPGKVPRLGPDARGCPFAPRCTRAGPECTAADPPVTSPAAGRSVACLHPHEAGEVGARSGGLP